MSPSPKGALPPRWAPLLGDGAAAQQPRRGRLALLVVAGVVVGLLTALWSKPGTAQEGVLSPVEGLTATLEDEVRDLYGGRIAWATYWQLCWSAYPGAIAYELQPLTSEGASRKLRRQSERCFRLEAVKGENDASQGLVSRDLLLALQRGQLAYRVRAVLGDQRPSPWSRPMAVGEDIRHAP